MKKVMWFFLRLKYYSVLANMCHLSYRLWTY